MRRRPDYDGSSRKPGHWWISLAVLLIGGFVYMASFPFLLVWTPNRSDWFVYIDHGALRGNNIGPMIAPPPPNLGAFGRIELYRNMVYEPWQFWPGRQIFGNKATEMKFWIPLHFFLLPFLVVVLWPILTRERARRRAALGRCTQCGYSLEGNQSGTCPECGAAVAPAKEKNAQCHTSDTGR